MKILLVTIIILLLLLIYSVKIVFSVKLNNFDFSVRILLKLPFEKEIYSNKRKQNKSEKKATTDEKTKSKMTLSKLKELKSPATDVVCEVCGLIKKHTKIVRLETKALSALQDPMENGIAFGIISAVLNVITLILKEQCDIKNVSLEILSDFDSGSGLLFESCGALKLRPIPMLLTIIFNRKLIKAIKDISDILNREEKENG